MARFYGRNNACIGWPEEPIRTIVQEIRNHNNRLSEKTIRTLFQKAVVELVEENMVSEDADPNADADVDSLLDELTPDQIEEKAKALHVAMSTTVHKYRVFVPLQGIDVNVPEFEIAGGVLYPKNSPQITNHVNKTSHPDAVKDEIEAIYATCSAYFVCTEEGDEQMAVHFARERARAAIHLLRFYLSADSLKSQQEHFQIRLVGEPEFDGRFAFICQIDDDNNIDRTHWSREAGPIRRYQLGRDQIDHMRNWEFETLHQAMIDSAGQKAGIQTRISRAIKWFSYAVAAHEIDQKFVGYAVALESLLTDSAKPDPTQSWGSITQKLAERCAFLLSDDRQKRKEIEKEIKELYGMRSQIVHGGSSVSEENIVRIQVYAHSAIIAFASHNFTSWEKFQDWINDLKYS